MTLKTLIESLVEEMFVLESSRFKAFDFNKFKQIAASSDRPVGRRQEQDFAYSGQTHPEIAYAKQFLPHFGAGSARTVFPISSGKVLKIAKNNNGFLQNKAEIEIFFANKHNDLVTRIYDFSSDYKWVLSELVRPTDEHSFFALSGLTEDDLENIKYFKSAEEAREHAETVMSDPNETFFETEVATKILKILDGPKSKEFLPNLLSLISKNNLIPGDIVPHHFGTTANGELRLYDYGYSEKYFV